jgi:ubiquinone/menaquinone biosynthesis C-methylase UbiE
LSADDTKFRIWDSYWHDNRLYSSGVEPGSDVLSILERFWVGITRRMPSGGTVLDVACGNGAASVCLVRAAEALGGTLAVTGIDEADIDPPRYVTDHAAVLQKIAFRPHTAMEALPAEDASFDAVVSQYGFEYGNFSQAFTEAARVLKPNGLLTFLVLPAHSPAAVSAKTALKQARYLLRDSSLFAEAFEITRAFHEGAEDTREQNMREHLERFNKEVEKSVRMFDAAETDVLFAIIMGLNKVFIDRKTQSGDEQNMTIEKIRTGLAQYAARAQVTVRAAVSEGNLGAMKRAMAAAGFKLRETRSLLAGKHGTIAWQLSAER